LVDYGAGPLVAVQHDRIARVCDETAQGQHLDQFPAQAQMTGSSKQFDLNVNDVIANRRPRIAGHPVEEM